MDAEKTREHMTKTLMERGFRITPQRAEIIRILCHDTTHPTSGTILRKARQRMPNISFSTVYYTLALLKKEQLIRELEFYDMDNRYDSELTDHIDLICTKCGTIANFEGDLLSLARELVEGTTGFETHLMRFEYRGLCEGCKGKRD